MSKPEQGKQMFDSAQKEFGGIDVLVNNAGIMKLADSSDELIDSQITINFKGTINTLSEAATRLNDGGDIVNFSTSVVGLHLETYGVFAAIKAGVETLTKILTKELKGRDISVNTVAPGPTATDLFLEGKSNEVIEELTNAIPLGRLGQPDDIANVVAFLVSEQGQRVNGQTLRANGGII